MRRLLAATFLTPVSAALIAVPAGAATDINDERTTPIATATANGSSADDIRITDKGSIKLGSGVAVTLNSNNSVTNQGIIRIQGADGAVGILAQTGLSGSITNTEEITIDEDYTPKDGDDDDDLDGAFALGSGRYGIRIAPGGTFTGDISNSGTIRIEGNRSAGIAVDSRLAGTFKQSGSISILGDDSYGIRAKDVAGDFKITDGSVSSQGARSVAVAVDGDIGGAFVLQASIVSTGYRYTSRPSDTSKLDADDLQQGGTALRIAGNVAGGIMLEKQPENKDDKVDDEDGDGVADSKESTAVVVSYGAAPALEIGSGEKDIRIGAVAGSNAAGHGIVIDGVVSAHGVYEGIAGNGLVIGSSSGNRVDIAGGMTVNGTVSAEAREAGATAIHIGSNASVPELQVAGTISASGANAKDASSTAVLIDQGATLRTIRNSGVISATVRAASDDDQDEGIGSAAAILDQSGTLSLVENQSVINGVGQKDAEGVAIDLRANGGGTTVRQLASDKKDAQPSITGSILFGAGSDTLEVADGKVTGTAQFGEGDNRLSLSGDSIYKGNISFGAGADAVSVANDGQLIGDINFGGGADRFTLGGKALYRGKISGSSNLVVDVGSGSLQATNSGKVELASLSVGQKGSIGVRIGTDGTTLYDVAGQASFGADTTLSVDLDKVSTAAGRHTVLRAGNLIGAQNITAAIVDIPFMYTGGLAKSENPNELAVEIRRKSTDELGLSGSRAKAFDAVLAAADTDKGIASAYLAVRDGESLKSVLQQMLPEHAGGAFETVSLASRAAAHVVNDPITITNRKGGLNVWLQQVGWGTSKSLGNTASYNVSGWGTAGGVELATGPLGGVGISLAYLAGRDADGGNDNNVETNQFEAAAYWRGKFGGFQGSARASAAKIRFNGTRYFDAHVQGIGEVTRTADGKWNGTLLSAASSLSYEKSFGRFSVRPSVTIDYYRLNEGAYTETGGGSAFNLHVAKRKSDELAGTGTLTFGYDLMSLDRENPWLRAEVEVGRREVIAGALGLTLANYEGGEVFALQAEEKASSWVGKFRLLGGGDNMQLGGEVGGEQRDGRAAVAARLGFELGL